MDDCLNCSLNLCKKNCPSNAIEKINGKLKKYLSRCINCNMCIEVCTHFDENVVIVNDIVGVEKIYSIGIIGCGIAGITAGNELAKYGHKITIYNDDVIWNRSQLFNSCFDKIKSTLHVHPDITVMENESVTSINSDKEIITKINSYKFDKIIIATGSKVSESIKGSDIENVYNFFEKNSVEKMVKDIREKSFGKAVVIGGGCIGIEAAIFLSKIGISSIKIVEKGKNLLSGILDEIIEKLLIEALEKEGIQVITDTFVSELMYDGIKCIDNQKIETDFIINASGVTPKFIEGIPNLTVNRGYIVDDRCETSIKDIFAIGDCSEFEGKIRSTIDNAVEQAQKVAEHINKNCKKKEKVTSFFYLKNAPINIVAAGYRYGRRIVKKSGSTLRIIYLQDNKITGFQAVNDYTPVPYVLYQNMKNKNEINENDINLFCYGNYSNLVFE